MDIIEAVKELYAGSPEKAAIYDSQFYMIWKNNDDVPLGVTLSDLVPERPTQVYRLPIEKDILCQCRTGCAVRIKPLRRDGEAAAYLLLFYGSEDIQQLVSHSEKLKENEVVTGNLRSNLSRIFLTLEKMKKDLGFSFLDTDREILDAVRTALSTVTNRAYVDRAFSPLKTVSAEDISGLLGFIAGEVRPLMENGGCVLTTDIERSVFADVDLKLMEASVLNLLVNGLMYSSALDKAISLTLRRDGPKALITVTDNGTSANLSRIRSLSVYAGRELEYKNCECLGLVLAKQTCLQLGGDLTFSLTPAGGLSAVMEFPCYPDGVPAEFRNARKYSPYTSLDPQTCILAKAVIGSEDGD